MRLRPRSFLLAAVAAGSVAFLLWHAQRRSGRGVDERDLSSASRPSSRSAPGNRGNGAELTEAVLTVAGVESELEEAAYVQAALAEATLSTPPNGGGAPVGGADEAARALSIPAYTAGITLPWLQRAAVAVHLGHPAELRRIAEEMAAAGQDVEAGLLQNYALLLERSSASRARVLTEVTRMLRAAMAHRRSAPFADGPFAEGLLPPGSPPGASGHEG